MATIDSLPTELLGLIFEHLSRLQLYHQVGQMALVCRRWRDPAQLALFLDVELDYEVRPWLDSRARLRYQTRSLTVATGGNSALPMAILDVCPALRSLDIGSAIDGGYEWCVGESAKDLRTLCIQYPERFPASPAPISFRGLHHLTVSVEGRDYELDIHILDSIFLPSSNHLLSISLLGLGTGAITASLVDVFRSTRFPNVRHLTLEVEPNARDLEESWSSLLTAFPSLLTLEIACPYQSSYLYFVAAIGTIAPSTLQNLIFAVGDSTAQYVRALAQMIGRPRLAGLRHLELPLHPKEDLLASKEGCILLDECERRAIAVVCRDRGSAE